MAMHTLRLQNGFQRQYSGKSGCHHYASLSDFANALSGSLTNDPGLRSTLLRLKYSLTLINGQTRMSAAAAAETRANLQDLYDQLDLLNRSQQLLPPSPHPGRNDQPWSWASVFQQHDIQLGLLTVFPCCPVPLHDHPGSAGINVILRGQMDIWQYDLPDAAQSYESVQSTSMSILLNERHTHARAGYMTLFNAQQGNIHGLQACDRAVTLLSILSPPYIRSQRNWYLPIFNRNPDTDGLYVRKVRLENT